jgi:hypothetical protein
LVSPGDDLSARKWSRPIRDNLRQVIAGDELHHQKRAFVFGEVIADSWQRRMRKLCQQTRFLLELSAQATIDSKGLFKRNRHLKSFIDGFVHCSHAARA